MATNGEEMVVKEQPTPSSSQPPAVITNEQTPNCPPGLEYLAEIDQLLVQQQMEVLELLVGVETNNQYRICNSMGQPCYFAAEESSYCMRWCCGTRRGFVLHVTDNAHREVMRISRPLNLCACPGLFGCCRCCNFEMRVEAPPGTAIGFVQSECYCCSPTFGILDADGNKALQVDGPLCMSNCCCDYKFDVNSLGGGSERVGRITKQWGGFVTEMYTDADNFSVSFPRDIDVKLKATMIGALFLIDFMYFEDDKGNKKRKLTTA